MKRIAFIIALISVFAFAGNSFAQKLKLGYVQVDSIFQLMPDRLKAQEELQQFSQQLEAQLLAMNSELETKYNEYKDNAAMSEIMKQDAEEELGALQQRIQNFQMRAQTEIQTKEAELLQPIYERIRQSIEQVATENGYTYIYDANMLLYKSPSSDNITNMVKAKLAL